MTPAVTTRMSAYLRLIMVCSFGCVVWWGMHNFSRPVHAQGGSAEVFYPLLDQQGTVRALTDASGAVAQQQSYDAWGALRHSEGDAPTTLGWAGERTGTADGLIYLRTRHYNPQLGRFLERDDYAGSPLRGQSRNRFSALEGNPVNYSDPTGREAVQPIPGRPIGRYIQSGDHNGDSTFNGYRRLPDGTLPLPPEIGAGHAAHLRRLSERSVDALFDQFGRGLVRIGGQNGRELLDRFRRNSSAPYYSLPGSPISQSVAENRLTQQLFRTMHDRLAANLGEQLWRGYVDLDDVRIEVQSDDRPHWGLGTLLRFEGHLAAPIGGTQSLEVALAEFAVDHIHHRSIDGGFRYQGEMIIRITDRFGLGHDDVYSRSLRAFWLLQHTHGYRPFQHVIEVRQPISGSVGWRIVEDEATRLKPEFR